MKVSYNWLTEIYDIKENAEIVADSITMRGLEVDKVVKTGIGKADVVVCEIIEVKKHPGADNLYITIVDAGKKGRKQIVTNVGSVKEGDKLLAALKGVKLANNLTIKKTNLKGAESEGMFVGWEELGIQAKSDDLFFLESDIDNGTNFEDLLPFNDSVIDIELTANRGDCLGMIGISREVKALFTGTENKLSTEYKTIEKEAGEIFSVEIRTENCLRYCGAVVMDADIKPSPYWMQLRLIKGGIRPINNVVDITNYVLLECNQPLHAFDMDKIAGRKIIVRDAFSDEKLTTLDDIERNLNSSDIVIADPERAHCMGGIMGGKISEVSDDTRNIFLEAAFFRSETIRKTSKKTGLRSESSYRFERAIDIENVDWALRRALYLFDKLDVGKICTGLIDVYPVKKEKKIIDVDRQWINYKLGTDIGKEIMIDILSKLGFEVKNNENNLKISVPSWRNDVQIKEDISEEIARIYGYNNIKHSHYPSYQSAMRTRDQRHEKSLRELMYKLGCDETFNYCFYGKGLFDRMLLPLDHHFRKTINLTQPLSDEWSGMGNSLIPGMIRTISYNFTRQNKNLSLFEISNISFFDEEKSLVQKKRLCIALAGIKKEKDYTSDEIKFDYYDIKGIIDSIAGYYSIGMDFIPSDECCLHPYIQAKIMIDNREAGIFGKIHPLVCNSFDIDSDVFILELQCDILFENIVDTIRCREIPKFPSSVRDLAVIIDEKISGRDIIDAIKDIGINILQDIKIFDIYRGSNIEEGKYSIAINLHFNKIISTLTDTEVEEAVGGILKTLREKYGAKIRI